MKPVTMTPCVVEIFLVELVLFLRVTGYRFSPFELMKDSLEYE